MKRSLKHGGTPWDIDGLFREQGEYAARLVELAPFVQGPISDQVSILHNKDAAVRIVQMGDKLNWEPRKADNTFVGGVEGYVASLQQPLRYLTSLVAREMIASPFSDELCITQSGADGISVLAHTALRCGLWWRSLPNNRLNIVKEVQLYGVAGAKTATLTQLQLHTSGTQVADLCYAAADSTLIAINYRQQLSTQRRAITHTIGEVKPQETLPRYDPLPSINQLREIYNDLSTQYP